LQKAQEAEVRIEEGNRRIELIDEQLSELMKKSRDLRERIDEECEKEHQDTLQKLEDTRERYVESQKELTRIKTDVSNTENQIESLMEQLEEVEKLKEDIDRCKTGTREWRFIARGIDGIKNLELDAFGPDISDVANRLLESGYGSRFHVRFETQRESGRGSRKKLIEDFDILVHDTRDGEETSIMNISGGELIFILQPIRDAFGIIRDNNTGLKILTQINDEGDSALTAENREPFLRMLETAHQLSGRRKTLIVTHSPELQAMIPQKILMDELKNGVKTDRERILNL